MIVRVKLEKKVKRKDRSRYHQDFEEDGESWQYEESTISYIV